MFHGALLINKHAGISSFGVVEELQRILLERMQKENPSARKRDLPKIGHGGTLDPFATGLLVVCVGNAVKLSRYFLGSAKRYEGVIRFGETTIPGDPTAPVSERSDVLPESRESIQETATTLTLQPYLQTPPMHSAKKVGGKVLYELAREGIEIEREPKTCQLYSFEILNYEKPSAGFRVLCSSGTYVRTLAQDLARMMGSVALLDSLHRTASGSLDVSQAWPTAQLRESTTPWNELPCWIPFDRLLDGFSHAEASSDEAESLMQGRQNVLFNILKRVQPGLELHSDTRHQIAIYCRSRLIAVANQTQGEWGLERVFPPNS